MMMRKVFLPVCIVTIIIGSFFFFLPPSGVTAGSDEQENEKEIEKEIETETEPEVEPETKPISELGAGALIMDTGWKWEHRQGDNYTRIQDTAEDAKPVTWIVAAVNHAGFPQNTVTLVSGDVVARYWFDGGGGNRWDNSSARAFLNKTFYRAFSADFRRVVVNTVVPNKDKNGNAYATRDRVFIPSLKETGHEYEKTFNDIGSTFSLFKEKPYEVSGSTDFIWTRSPITSADTVLNRLIGLPLTRPGSRERHLSPERESTGILPVLNMKDYVTVYKDACEITGAYKIAEFPYDIGDVNGDGEVTVTDAITVLRHIVGLITLEDDKLKRAHVTVEYVTGDDNVTVRDAIEILRIIVGLA